jgi:hypothetical protein
MATLQSHVPASLRNNSPSRRANSGNLSSEDSRPYLIAGRKGRTASTTFLALPNEPEDAKLTGATRSLDRRLLGLNLCGSLMRGTINGTMVSIKTLTGIRIA